MSNLLKTLIDRARSIKTGNKDFALFGGDDPEKPDQLVKWTAMIGNAHPMVQLGEVSGDYEADGDTPEEAVINLIHVVRRGQWIRTR